MLLPVWVPLADGPPTELQLKLKPTLLAVVCAQAVTAIMRIASGDAWGGASDVLVAAIGYISTRETAIMYAAYYGMACSLNFMFDVVGIMVRLDRLKYGYFNPEAPFLFNLASFSLLAAAVTTLLGAALSLTIWRDFNRSQSEAIPLRRTLPLAGGTFVAPPGAAGSWRGAGPGGAAAGGVGGGRFAAFSGQGFRLNADPLAPGGPLVAGPIPPAPPAFTAPASEATLPPTSPKAAERFAAH